MPRTSQMPAEQRSGRSLAGLAIRRPVTVCMVFVLMVVLGVIACIRIPLMLMPQLDAPVMFVRANYYNASPEQVLESITKPIEEAIATVPGVERMNSTSAPNGAQIRIWCGLGVDTSMLRSDIREKIDRIRDDLPDDLRQVDVMNFSTDEIPILEGTLFANRDLRTNYEFVRSRVQRPLERIPGVGSVTIWGTDRQQFQVYLRAEDLKRHAVDVGRLYRSLDAAVLNQTLGRLSEGGRRYTAMSRGAVESVEQIAEFPIGQQSLVLGDVADVALYQQPRNSGRHQNGVRAVGLVIQKTSEANSVEVVDQVVAEFERWEQDPSMDGLTVRWWHNSGDEIRKGLSDLLEAGIYGASLAILVLFAFLRRMDASFAISLAIPFSVLTAVGLLYLSGGTLNLLSTMGLILACGMLVDNAVVVLESIYSRLQRGEAPARAARRGAREVTLAVIAATSTTMIIFVPLLVDSESTISVLLSNVGLSIILALLCSLFISLTLIPLVASRFLHRRSSGRGWPGRPRRWAAGMAGRFLRRGPERPPGEPVPALTERYLGLVNWHLDRRYVLGLLAIPAVLSLAIWTLVRVVPDNAPDESATPSLRIEYDFSENYHYEKIERDFVTPVEEFLHSNEERFRITSTSSSYSNSQASTQVYLDGDGLSSEEFVELRRDLSRSLPDLPGATIDLGSQGGSDRNWISASIYGNETEVLRSIAERARSILLEREDVSEVHTSRTGSRDEIRVRLKREAASRFGVTPRSVSQVLGITVRSERLRNIRTPEGEAELWVGLHPADMQSVEDLKSLVVGARPDGRQILLENVADLQMSPVPVQIHREDRRTSSEIVVAFRGNRIEDGRKAVTAVLDDLVAAAGYDWSFGFWTQQQGEDVKNFIFNMVLAFIMVYLVMAALFESVLHPFAIMLALPFASVGIVLILLLTGTPFSAMAQVAIIILIGVVVNNGIVLINHINNLRRQGLERREAIEQGCQERLRPICMTAMTTVVGLIPLALGDAGLSGMTYYPLALTLIGGLLASTVLTLLVLPTYYVILDDLGQWFRGLWFEASRPGMAPGRASGD